METKNRAWLVTYFYMYDTTEDVVVAENALLAAEKFMRCRPTKTILNIKMVG